MIAEHPFVIASGTKYSIHSNASQKLDSKQNTN